MSKTYFFTSESVTEGHPDKICDQISDAILDAALSKDKNARVANIGYDRGKYGFDAENIGVLVALDEQSKDIAMGVDKADGQIGAGDQGMMFGYATDETDSYMPISMVYAQKLALKLAKVKPK